MTTSPAFSVSSVPSTTRKPGFYFGYNTSGAVNSLPANDQKMLVIGQRTANGSVAANVLQTVYDSETAATYFGRGSIAHLMVKELLTANAYLQVDVITLDDATAGVMAGGSVTLAGTATAAGSVTLYVAGVAVTVALSSGDTAAVAAADLVAQVANQPDLPVTAAVDANNPAKINVTPLHKGAAGNGIALSWVSQTTGITATVAQLSGGQNDPDIQPALTTVFGAGHTMIVVPYTTQTCLLTLKSHLTQVSNSIEQRRATGYAGWSGTIAQGITLAEAINCERISIAWHNGSACPQWQIAAGYAATGASEDDPGRPWNTLTIAGLDITAASQWPSRTEQESALHNGLTPLEIGPDGTSVQIVRAISTYLVTANGVADDSLLDITTIRCLDYMAKAWRDRIRLRFPRAKNSERVRKLIRSELLAVAKQAEDAELIENVDAYKDQMLVQQGNNPTWAIAKIPCDIIPGLHVFAAEIDLILG